MIAPKDEGNENFALLDNVDEGKSKMLKSTYGSTENVGFPAPSHPSPSPPSSPSPLMRWRKRGSKLIVRLNASRKVIVLNKTFCVMLFLFCLIELTDELIINSVSIITRRYFGWHGSLAGLFITLLGIFVLPANFFTEKACHHYDERAVARFMLALCIVGTLFTFNFQVLLGYPDHSSATTVIWNVGDIDDDAVTGDYPSYRHPKHVYNGQFGVYQYIIGISWVFTGTIMLEGVVTSLMAKSAPSGLENSFLFNAGLLATLTGTAGRVVADGFILFAGYLHSDDGLDFTNSILMMLVIALGVGLYSVQHNYYRLFVSV